MRVVNSRVRRDLLRRIRILSIVCLLAPAAICGCGSLSVSAKGARIVEGRQIPIEVGTERNGRRQTADLLITYQYLVTGNTLEMWGSVRFAAGIRMNFTTLRNFNLQLLIADSQGVVRATVSIASSTFRRTEDELTFHRSLTLPHDAQMMAFAYRGNATEGGRSRGRPGIGDRAMETTFFDFPVMR